MWGPQQHSDPKASPLTSALRRTDVLVEVESSSLFLFFPNNFSLLHILYTLITSVPWEDQHSWRTAWKEIWRVKRETSGGGRTKAFNKINYLDHHMWTISVSWCCCQLLLLLLRGELEKRSPSSWQELEWGLSTKLATGGRPPPPAVHRVPANFQPMWPCSHPRQFELILCMKFGGRQCQMFNWNQDARFPSSTRFVNPVKNKIKAIKLVWHHLSFMQAIHDSWFPILCLPLPHPQYLFCCIYDPSAGPAHCQLYWLCQV